MGPALFVAAILPCSPAWPSETVTYSYDALGRLIVSAIANGPNNSRVMATCFDKAGNRARQVNTTGAAPSCPTSTNQPPVANADSVAVARCGYVEQNLTVNDTDPEGNYPLTLVSTNRTWVAVISASSVAIDGPMTAGTYPVSYVVKDSLGATSTGTLTVTVTSTNGC